MFQSEFPWQSFSATDLISKSDLKHNFYHIIKVLMLYFYRLLNYESYNVNFFFSLTEFKKLNPTGQFTFSANENDTINLLVEMLQHSLADILISKVGTRLSTDKQIKKITNNDLNILITNQNNKELENDIQLTNCIIYNHTNHTATFRHHCININMKKFNFIKEHLKKISDSIINNKSIQLKQLQILPERERQILLKYNNQQSNINYIPLIDEFNNSVKLYPNSIAISSGSVKLTFSELHKRMLQWSDFIFEYAAVASNRTCIIYVEDSLCFIQIMLAALNCKLTYVPIDYQYPIEYIKQLMNTIAVDFIVSQKKFKSSFCNKNKIQFLAVEDFYESPINISDLKTKLTTLPNNDYANIMFTSGSTGKPKGILMNQRGILRIVKNKKFVNINSNDVVLQSSSLSFDASTYNMWLSLTNGACLYITKVNDLLDSKKLQEILLEQHISHIFLTTKLLEAHITNNAQMFASVKYVLFGGERVNVQKIKQLTSSVAVQSLYHCYGPTENSIFTTAYKIPAHQNFKDDIPIGKPMLDTKLFIVDKFHNLVPCGSIGEIIVSGHGLASGYIGSNNKKSFIHLKSFIQPTVNCRYYKTGDLGTLNNKLELIFKGRIDFMVKVRGYRIEPEYIENMINQHQLIKKSCVTYTPQTGILLAYIEPADTNGADNIIDKLKQYLSKNIPLYMMPNKFIISDKILLNSRGKIDRSIFT